MRDKILSEQIVRGTWYKTNGRVELLEALKQLISENMDIELSEDLKLFRRLKFTEIEKPYHDLFEWAQGREDCHVVTRPLGYGKFCYDLYQGGKLLSIR